MRLIWVGSAILAACEPAKPPPKPLVRVTEPQMAATVVTIQTTLEPQNKTFIHWVVIADGLARSGDEVDQWRLFDLSHNRITLVDDIEKTFSTQPVETVPSKATTVVATGAKRIIQGVEAAQFVTRRGAYQRELWIGMHPSIPSNLFGMMNASDETLSKIRGFPLVDHAELPYESMKMVVDHTVLKVEQRDVPQSWLRIPRDYKEVTAPDEHRPPASSPPPSRSTRAAVSRFFSTIRKKP